MSRDERGSKTLAEVLRPPDQQDEFTAWMLTKDGGFVGAKKLPDGTYAGVVKLAFTDGICLDITQGGFCGRRFCYDHLGDCLVAFDKIVSKHDDPIGWVASRPKPQEEEWRPIATAPQDGTYIRAANFAFGHCHYCRSAAYRDGWVEVDSSRDGQPLVDVTHWLP